MGRCEGTFQGKLTFLFGVGSELRLVIADVVEEKVVVELGIYLWHDAGDVLADHDRLLETQESLGLQVAVDHEAKPAPNRVESHHAELVLLKRGRFANRSLEPCLEFLADSDSLPDVDTYLEEEVEVVGGRHKALSMQDFDAGVGAGDLSREANVA